MNAAEMKSKIHSVIEAMPLGKLDAVLAFLEDIQRSGEDEIALLMREPGVMRDYRESKEDIHTNGPVNLKAIRSNV